MKKKSKIVMMAGGITAGVGGVGGTLSVLGICSLCITSGVFGGLGFISIIMGAVSNFNIFFIVPGIALFLIGLFIHYRHKKTRTCKIKVNEKKS